MTLLILTETAVTRIAQDSMPTTSTPTTSMQESSSDSGALKHAVLSTDVETAMWPAMRDVTTETEKEGTAAPCIASILRKAGNVQSMGSLVFL